MSVAIISTSYNQLGTLRLMVESLRRQTVSEFEVVIADDGSSDGTAEYVNSIKDLKVRFVTQEDKGYRKSRIVNEAISKTEASYLIFVDSDVILGKHFVEDHLLLRAQDSFVCGRRVELGPEVTRDITPERVGGGEFDELHWSLFWKLLKSTSKKDTKNWKRALRITRPLLRKIMGYQKPLDLLGSNMSMWRQDLIGINGFNESLESYWGEDGDLFIRLRNSAKKPINGKGACVQYHLYHPRRQPTPENVDKVYALLQRTDYKWAEHGYRDRFRM